jgi:hypothetical protein
MRTVSRRIAALFVAATSLPALAQWHAAPVPWQSVTESMAQGKPPSHMSVSSEMEPLPFRQKPWQVALVVEHSDPARGAFCHGAFIAPGWLMTAASCVCSKKQGELPIEVILDPQTSTQPARRVKIKSEAGANKIWLLQDNQYAVPSDCLAEGAVLPGGIRPTPRDLALVKLDDLDKVQAVNGTERRELQMMGADSTKLLLPSLAEGVLAPLKPPEVRDVKVEAVVVAARNALTSTGSKYAVVADFVVSPRATLNLAACDSPQIPLASGIDGAGNIYTICSNPRLRGGQSLRGTAVVMADHKTPLLLGIQGGRGYEAMDSRVSTTTQTVALSVESLVKTVTAGGDGTTHWRPLHTAQAPPPPPPACNVGTGPLRQIDGVSIFQIGGVPSVGDPVYVFHTNRLAAVARGAPNAYYPKDRKPALDTIKNAGNPPGGFWSPHLYRVPGGKMPFVQSGGAYDGYYVSYTDLWDDDFYPWDPRAYVDAATVPYYVLSRDWSRAGDGIEVGDFVVVKSLVIKDGKVTDGVASGGIIAHVGGSSVGTMSLKMLGNVKVDPKQQISAIHGVNPAMDVMVMVFPGSRLSGQYRHMDVADIHYEAERLRKKAGGWPDLSCLKR